jgi:hypothetical protein
MIFPLILGCSISIIAILDYQQETQGHDQSTIDGNLSNQTQGIKHASGFRPTIPDQK